VIVSELVDDMVRRKLCIIEATFQNEWLDLDRFYLASNRRRGVGCATEALVGLWDRLNDAGYYDLAAPELGLLLARPEGL
jgi:hypothetical protein